MLHLKNNNIKNIQKKKFFYPILTVIGFCIVTLAVLYVGSAPSVSQLKEGDVWLRSVYAPYDFTYPTNIDEKKTEEARREFEVRVLPVYDINQSVQNKAFTDLGDFFDNLEFASKRQDLTDSQKLELLKSESNRKLQDKYLSVLIQMNGKEKMRKAATDALENIFLVGMIDTSLKAQLLDKKAKQVLVRNLKFDIEREIKTQDIVDEKEAQRIVLDSLDRMIPENRSARSAIFNLIKYSVVPNLAFNEIETKERKEKARNQVSPIYERKTVKKNELIIEKGKRLTKSDIAKLTQITSIHSAVNRTSYISGLFILLLCLALVTTAYLALFDKRIVVISKNVLLIGINAFLAILISLVVLQAEILAYIIPLASVGMILALLLNTSVAFALSLALSIFIGFMAGGNLGLSLMLFVGSAAGIYFVRDARKRSRIFFAGFAVSVMNFIAIAGIGFLNNVAREIILIEGLWGIANGIVSSFIVIGLLPVFEYAFKLITNITLLELSDLSNPLLKELTIKAPGTYHHCILVGNLAEEACDTIGANSLLARVGAYYHDIGKIEKAEYFAENELGSASKHEKLAPSMSALIITNHTKDGALLAKRYKVNNAIIDFISQHHGTSLIYYFYQRALEKTKSEDVLNEEEFRYTGPKPQTKETAIVLLADSVEASSRMLSDPTPARIRSLVQKIINNKFIDGQLDECDLTLRDLHKIAESFVRILTGVFHTRLEYPDVKSKKERKNAAKNKNKQSQ